MTVQEGVETAKLHLVTLMPEFSSAELQLEEFETPPHRNNWRFTFSVTLPLPPSPTLSQLMRGQRLTKSIDIDPETGDLLAMRNAAA